MFLYIGGKRLRSISEEKKDGSKFQTQGKRPPSSGLVQLGLMRRHIVPFLCLAPFRRINP